MQHQIQPQEISASCGEPVEDEIQSFLQAVDSYPARVAKEPGISFQQHFQSIRAAEKDRGRNRSRAT